MKNDVEMEDASPPEENEDWRTPEEIQAEIAEVRLRTNCQGQRKECRLHVILKHNKNLKRTTTYERINKFFTSFEKRTP